MFKSIIVFGLIIACGVAAQSVDPTRPLDGSQISSSYTSLSNELVLQSIITNSQEKRVIISGQLLMLGQHINQYTLTKISDKEVTLSSQENSIKLSLYTSVSKAASRKSLSYEASN